MRKIWIKRSILIYILFALLMIFAVFMKKNYHVDELYSYGLSNHQGGLFLELEEFETYGPDQSPYSRYMLADEGERFDYGMVIENQIKDVHPPLYYILLHTICSIFAGTFSNWYAAVINLTFALGTLYILRKIIRFFVEDEKICDFMSLFFIVSPGILNAAIFFRMYMMAMFFVTLLTWILLRHEKENDGKSDVKFYAAMTVTAIAAAMTHYYCIVYIVLLAVVYVAYLLWKKERKEILNFCISMGSSGLVSYLLFPNMLNHVFRGGERSVDNLYDTSDYFSRLRNFGDIIGTQLLGGRSYWILGLLLAAGVVYMLLRKSEKPSKVQCKKQEFWKTGYGLLVIPTVLYYLIISQIAIYVTDRYMYPIYPQLMIVVMGIIVHLAQRLFREKNGRRIVLALFVLLTIGGYAGFDGGYFYQESADMLEEAEKYRDVDCVIIFGEEWTLPSLYPEVKNYKSVTFVSEENFQGLQQSDLWKDEVIVTCVGVSSGQPYFDGVEALSGKSYERKKIGSFSYGSSYLYYKKE